MSNPADVSVGDVATVAPPSATGRWNARDAPDRAGAQTARAPAAGTNDTAPRFPPRSPRWTPCRTHSRSAGSLRARPSPPSPGLSTDAQRHGIAVGIGRRVLESGEAGRGIVRSSPPAAWPTSLFARRNSIDDEPPSIQPAVEPSKHCSSS